MTETYILILPRNRGALVMYWLPALGINEYPQLQGSWETTEVYCLTQQQIAGRAILQNSTESHCSKTEVGVQFMWKWFQVHTEPPTSIGTA